MAEQINISITTTSDFKAVDQLIARMKHMREEIGKMATGLNVGANFAKEINKAIAANDKLERSVKSVTKTEAAAERQRTALWRHRLTVATRSQAQIDRLQKQREAAEMRYLINQERRDKRAADAAKKAVEDQFKAFRWLSSVKARYYNEEENAWKQHLKEMEKIHKSAQKEMDRLDEEQRKEEKRRADEYENHAERQAKEEEARHKWLMNIRQRYYKEEEDAYNRFVREMASEHKRSAEQLRRIDEEQRREEKRHADDYQKHLRQQRKEEEAADRAYIQFQKNLARDNERLANQETRRIQALNRARLQAFANFRQGLQNFSQSLGAIMQNINRFLTLLGTGMSRGLMSASSAIGRLSSTAGSHLSKLSSYLASTGKNFLNFSNIVGRSMKSGQNSMSQFYNAGFSMLASGAILNQFGSRIFGMMGNVLNDYMEYEKMLTRTAISAALPSDMAGRYPEGPYGGQQVRPDFIQDLVFGLQRGTFGESVKGFDAKELAQGIYYYTSAIGQPITPDNMGQLGPIIADILQVASATQTSPETMIKGVMNAAMEFGIRPEQAAAGDPEMTKWFENLAAQMGFLANITTMEVPDIAEAFKMVGPMAHILTDRDAPGAGLNEMFALTAFASEMGLRGGNVGRGINQALTTLLDPTQPAIEAAAKAFGIGASEEAFREFFFTAEGVLEGGLPGLFEKLSKLPAETAAPLLASLFTTNATRSILAIEQAIRQGGDMKAMVARIAGIDAQQWADMATEAVNKTLYGSFNDMKNAWFEVQVAIVDGVRGPLISVFNKLADVFRMIADVLSENPLIVKFIASLVTAVATVATLTGGLLFFLGTLLLLARGLAMVGAAGRPFLILLTALPRLLLTISPILLLLAALGAALYSAWTNNFLGMSDSVQQFIKGFSIEDDVVPKLMSLLMWLQRLGKAFTELVNGILLGFGPTNNLGAMLQSIFGPLLGTVFFSMLLRLREGLDGARKAFIGFVSSLKGGGLILSNIGLSIQGFLESLFLGQRREETMYSQSVLGRALGIENLPSKLKQAANGIRSFVMMAIGYFGMLRDAIFEVGKATVSINPFGGGFTVDNSIAGQIKANIESVFSSLNSGRIREVLGSFFTGIAQGFAAAMITAAKAVEALSKALASAGKAGDWINDYLEKWFDFRVTVTGIAQAVGIAIGTWLGARLVTMVLPGINILLRFGIALVQISIGVAAAVVQFALFLVRIVAVTAALAAQLAVTIAFTAARVALFAIQTAISGLQALMIIQQAAATGVTVAQAAATAGLAGSFVALLAGMGPVAAILLALVGAGLLVATVFVGIGAAMLVHTAATEGLTAAWNGLVQMYQGFMSVAAPVVGALTQIVSYITHAIRVIMTFIGVGDSFYAIGVLIAGGLTLAVAALIAFIASLIAANLPIIAIVAGIGLILYALNELGILDDIFRIIGSGIEWLAGKIVDLAGVAKEAAAAILDVFGIVEDKGNTQSAIAKESARSEYVRNQMGIGQVHWSDEELAKNYYGHTPTKQEMEQFNQYIPATGSEAQGNFQPSYRPRDRAIEKMWTEGWNRTNGGYTMVYGPNGPMLLDPVDKAKYEESVAKASQRTAEDTAKAGAESAAKGWKESIRDIADRAGLTDLFADIAGPDGFLNLEEITKALSPEGLKELQSAGYDEYDLYSIMPGLDEYQTQVEEYQAWQKAVTELGYSGAVDMYAAMGRAIPTQPPSFDEFIQGMVEGSNEALDEMNLLIQDWDQFNADFTAAIQDIDLPTLLQAAYSKTPDSQMTLAAYLGANASTIVGTLQEAAPWMNEVELLMDAAIEGGLSKGVYGVNIHEALKKPLQGVSEETGVALEDMLKDIPTYVADERYLPMAITQMMQGIGQLPMEVRHNLDNLGQDIGKALSWEELSRYAVSQEQAGNFDWTFVDYLSDAWDMTRREVTDYIHSKGIDITDVQRALFPDELRDYILSAGGEVSVIAQEAYDYALSHTFGPDDKTIEVTKREWAALDEATKIGLTNMGYTFIVGGSEAAAQAQTSAQNILDSFRNAYGGDDPEGARFQFIKDLENGYLLLKNLDTGETIEVPALEYAAYKESVQEIQRLAQMVLASQESIRSYFNTSTVEGAYAASDYLDIAQQAGYGQAAGEAPSYEITLKPTVDEAAAKTAGTTVVNTVANEITNSTAISTAIVNEVNQGITEAASTIQTQSSGYAGTGAGSPSGAAASGPFDGLFAGYGVTAAKAFVDSVRENMTFESGTGNGATITSSPFDGTFTYYGILAAQAFQNSFSRAMAGWSPTTPSTPQNNNPEGPPTVASSSTSYTATLTLDHSAFDVAMGQVLLSLVGFRDITWTTKLDADNTLFANAYNPIYATLVDDYKKTHVATLATVGQTTVNVTLDGILTKLTTLDNTTASANVSVIGASGAQSSLASIISQLNVIDAKDVTATVTTVYKQSGTLSGGSDGNPNTPYARGGIVDSPLQVVGELGPELAALPMGTHIFTAQETRRMLRADAASASRPRLGSSFANSDVLSNTRNMEYHPTASGQGDIKIEVDQIIISKEVDVDRAFERFDRLLGQKMELSQRGMIPVRD